MAITNEGGATVITGPDVDLYRVTSLKFRLHLELTVPAFVPVAGRLLRKSGQLQAKDREQAYREWCAKHGLDPACRTAKHDHGPQTTFRVRQPEGWVVVYGEGGSERQ